MKKLCFISDKGGVGKTTSVQNIAGYLATEGFKILLIDLDPQRGNLSRTFGIQHEDIVSNSGDLILEMATFDNVVMKSELIDLIPSTKRNKDNEILLAGRNMYHTKLKKVLKQVEDQYDYCLIDCPPALSAFTTSALYASDFYFVPLQAKFLSYEGLASILDHAREIEEGCGVEIKLGGVFATQYNPAKRVTMDHEVIQSVEKQIGNYYFKECFIRENNALNEAQANGKNIFEYSPNSNGATDYARLSRKILNTIS